VKVVVVVALVVLRLALVKAPVLEPPWAFQGVREGPFGHATDGHDVPLDAFEARGAVQAPALP
jgi:hypothetical protein